MLTNEWHKTLLLVIDDSIINFTVGHRRVFIGAVGVTKAALEMAGPEFAKPRIAAVDHPRSFYNVDILFGAAHFTRTWAQRLEIVVKSCMKFNYSVKDCDTLFTLK